MVRKRRRRIKRYFVTYIGRQKNIRLSGVGRVHIGKEFEVSEKIANALRSSKNWKIREGYGYEEI